MRLTSVRPGDIVLVDDGLPYHAIVREKLPRELRVEPIRNAARRYPRPIKAREIRGHWSQRRTL